MFVYAGIRVGGFMRNCKKNQRRMYYALYSDRIPIVDENGNEEFEYQIGYEKPVEFYACLSYGQSNAEESPFGTNVSYDRVISTADTSLPIDENSIIWVRNEPIYNEDGTVDGASADYKVAALPLDGLNSLRIAIKKVSNPTRINSVKEDEKKPDSENSETVDEEDGF